MEKRKSRLVDWWWLLLLPIAVFVVAGQIGGASAAAKAGEFPAFIAMPGVTPRGVAVNKVGNVYVSFGEVRADGEHILIWKFTPAGKPSFFAEIGRGTIGGLAVTANGDLYVAMAAGADKGVWRVDREGQKELLPNSNQIFFANGLAFDDRGTLYVTESVSVVSLPPRGPGGIWRIPRGGQAELWMRDELQGNRCAGPARLDRSQRHRLLPWQPLRNEHGEGHRDSDPGTEERQCRGTRVVVPPTGA